MKLTEPRFRLTVEDGLPSSPNTSGTPLHSTGYRPGPGDLATGGCHDSTDPDLLDMDGEFAFRIVNPTNFHDLLTEIQS